jgi:ribonuclease HI
MAIEIYTDGACSGNPGYGGWAYLILDHNLEIMVADKGFIHQFPTTNNYAELSAVLEALGRVLGTSIHSLEKYKIFRDNGIVLYSDSQYAIHGINEWMQNWKKNGWKNSDNIEIANRSLWVSIYYMIVNLESRDIRVEFEYVPAHTGNKFNEKVDRAAKIAVKNFKQHIIKLKNIRAPQSSS